jgi:tRNA pseudouridine55 synthase
VRVSEWTWLAFAFPEARFRVRCSGGTYVRTLAHDLGQRLGCGAALATLRRLRSEPFGLERSVTLEELERDAADAVLARAGIPLDEALGVLPALTLEAGAAIQVGHGQRPAFERRAVEDAGVPIGAGPRSVVARDAGGRALALGEIVADPARGGWVRLHPHVVFPWAARRGRG